MIIFCNSFLELFLTFFKKLLINFSNLFILPECSGKLDIIFALEVSGFVGEANLNLMKNFVKVFIISIVLIITLLHYCLNYDHHEHSLTSQNVCKIVVVISSHRMCSKTLASLLAASA